MSGGWIGGGGHGALSNQLGLGVDRTLQFKVVTPDGVLRVANDCQNTDLYFALRGGGGGTFGVVMETTMIAAPAMKLQVRPPFPRSTRTLILTDPSSGRLRQVCFRRPRRNEQVHEDHHRQRTEVGERGLGWIP